MYSYHAAGTCLSLPFINWGQVISVTAENVLGANNVTLTFLERKVQIRNHKKISQEEGREKTKLLLHSSLQE